MGLRFTCGYSSHCTAHIHGVMQAWRVQLLAAVAHAFLRGAVLLLPYYCYPHVPQCMLDMYPLHAAARTPLASYAAHLHPTYTRYVLYICSADHTMICRPPPARATTAQHPRCFYTCTASSSVLRFDRQNMLPRCVFLVTQTSPWLLILCRGNMVGFALLGVCSITRLLALL